MGAFWKWFVITLIVISVGCTGKLTVNSRVAAGEEPEASEIDNSRGANSDDGPPADDDNATDGIDSGGDEGKKR